MITNHWQRPVIRAQPWEEIVFPRLPPQYYRHRVGGILDVYKHALLTTLLAEKHSYVRAPLTYIDFNAGTHSYDMTRSLHRTVGIDGVYEMGRAMQKLARNNKAPTKHSFVHLVHAIRMHNARYAQAATDLDGVVSPTPAPSINTSSSDNPDSYTANMIPRLQRNFSRYPGNIELIRPQLRPHDRAILFEGNQEDFSRLTSFCQAADDKRLTTINLDAYGKEGDAVSPHVRPMTAHALINIDIGRAERFEGVTGQMIRIQLELIPSIMQRFPHATILCTYPIYRNAHPDEFVRSFVAGGSSSVLHTHFFAQQEQQGIYPGRSAMGQVGSGDEEQDPIDEHVLRRLELSEDEPWVSVLL